MPSTVFVVDDEKNIRRTVRMVLEGEGFAVEEASSGEEAIARLPDVGADLMLLDVQLSGISGLETLERLSAIPTAASSGGGGTPGAAGAPRAAGALGAAPASPGVEATLPTVISILA